MGRTEADTRRYEAMRRLRGAVEAFASATADPETPEPERDRLLADLRQAVELAGDVLLVLEHRVRGSLTVVKGRAQLLRRYALTAPQPDGRLVAGLEEIDGAAGQIVTHLDLLVEPRHRAFRESAEPPDGE